MTPTSRLAIPVASSWVRLSIHNASAGWVIRINPLARAVEPTDIADIADRRNELSGNLSLEQELYFIGKVNEKAGRLGGRYRHIEVREMPSTATSTWQASSIAAPGFITELQHEGRQKAERFLSGLPG
jgi:NTE family protein